MNAPDLDVGAAFGVAAALWPESLAPRSKAVQTEWSAALDAYKLAEVCDAFRALAIEQREPFPRLADFLDLLDERRRTDLRLSAPALRVVTENAVNWEEQQRLARQVGEQLERTAATEDTA